MTKWSSQEWTESAAAEVLGVPVDAGPKEVVAAYRRYVRTHHPDSAGDHGESSDATVGAALAQAARARECLLGSERPAGSPAEALASTRKRAFHKSSPWWRRMMFWR